MFGMGIFIQSSSSVLFLLEFLKSLCEEHCQGFLVNIVNRYQSIEYMNLFSSDPYIVEQAGYNVGGKFPFLQCNRFS